MAHEHGKCGCNHDHEREITRVEPTAPHDAAASCCGGGHHGPDTADDELLEASRGA